MPFREGSSREENFHARVADTWSFYGSSNHFESICRHFLSSCIFRMLTFLECYRFVRYSHSEHQLSTKLSHQGENTLFTSGCSLLMHDKSATTSGTWSYCHGARCEALSVNLLRGERKTSSGFGAAEARQRMRISSGPECCKPTYLKSRCKSA